MQVDLVLISQNYLSINIQAAIINLLQVVYLKILRIRYSMTSDFPDLFLPVFVVNHNINMDRSGNESTQCFKLLEENLNQARLGRELRDRITLLVLF